MAFRLAASQPLMIKIPAASRRSRSCDPIDRARPGGFALTS